MQRQDRASAIAVAILEFPAQPWGCPPKRHIWRTSVGAPAGTVCRRCQWPTVNGSRNRYPVKHIAGHYVALACSPKQSGLHHWRWKR
jgi:hypothetical protein